MHHEPAAAPQTPAPPAESWGRIARATARFPALLVRRRVRQPPGSVGRAVAFADGTSSRVYRETVMARVVPADPAALVVGFRLRAIRGERAHAAFRAESLLNTAMFVGFDGFVSKLWLRHDEQGLYRGIYQWDDARLAEDYARSLWHVLGLVSVPGSIRYVVVPAGDRDELVDARIAPDAAVGSTDTDWWRPVAPGV